MSKKSEYEQTQREMLRKGHPAHTHRGQGCATAHSAPIPWTQHWKPYQAKTKTITLATYG